MYIPSSNKLSDKTEIISFMQRFSFATVVSSLNDKVEATHLPFVVEVRGDDIILISHFAKANDHYKNMKGSDVLVIFAEPHAYISPTHYEKIENVPTWNYIAIHTYGTPSFVYEHNGLIKILEATMQTYEASYRKQWDALSETYKTNMVKGIVGFEMKIEKIEAKKKIGQNKTENEQLNMKKALSASENATDRLLSEYM